jgi:hypothetical protein
MRLRLSHSNKLEKKTIFLEHRNDFYSSQGFPDSTTEKFTALPDVVSIHHSIKQSNVFHIRKHYHQPWGMVLVSARRLTAQTTEP